MTVKHILLGLFLLSNWYTVFTIDSSKEELNLLVVWNIFSILSCIAQVCMIVATLLMFIVNTKIWDKVNNWLDEPITFKKKK